MYDSAGDEKVDEDMVSFPDFEDLVIGLVPG
jgi:hypothetical protein